jgi:hypothetical protein
MDILVLVKFRFTSTDIFSVDCQTLVQTGNLDTHARVT